MSHAGIGLEEMRGWVSRLNSLLTVCLEAHVAIEECSVRKHLALQENRPIQVKKWETERKKRQRELDTASALLREWTGRATLNDANDLIVDIRVRLQRAWELHEAWRKALSMIELLQTLGRIDPTYTGDDVTQAAATAAQFRTEMDAQIQLAAQLMPANALEVLACN